MSLRALACVPSAAAVLGLYRYSDLPLSALLLAAAALSLVAHLAALGGLRGLAAPWRRKGFRWALPAAAATYAGTVLFGGPLLSLDSLAFALYFAATFVVPEGDQERIRFGRELTGIAAFGPPSDHLVLGVLAAWVGCLAIPLDWDRPWQQFPIASSLCCAVCSVATGIFIKASEKAERFWLKKPFHI